MELHLRIATTGYCRILSDVSTWRACRGVQLPELIEIASRVMQLLGCILGATHDTGTPRASGVWYKPFSACCASSDLLAST